MISDLESLEKRWDQTVKSARRRKEAKIRLAVMEPVMEALKPVNRHGRLLPIAATVKRIKNIGYCSC